MPLGGLLILEWQRYREVNGCFGASCLCQGFVFVGHLLFGKSALAYASMQSLLLYYKVGWDGLNLCIRRGRYTAPIFCPLNTNLLERGSHSTLQKPNGEAKMHVYRLTHRSVNIKLLPHP